MTTSAIPDSPLLHQRERLWPVVLLSLAVHVAAIGAAVLHRPAPQIDLSQKPIVAKLVRLGEKRPQHYLPRKEEPPPAPAASPHAAPVPVAAAKPQPPAPAPKPVVKATAPAPPKPAPAVRKGPESRGDVLASVLAKARKERDSEPVYGDPDGDPMGDASEASAGDQYLALVVRALRESYVLPSTISERDRMHLTATVVLYLDADGRVMRFSFETPSGNGAFDAALERAIRAARLPPPPADLRQRYRSEGLGVMYRP